MVTYENKTLVPYFLASLNGGSSRNQVFTWDDIHHTMDVAQALAQEFPQERFTTVSQGDDNVIWVDFQPGQPQDLMAILKFAQRVPLRGE